MINKKLRNVLMDMLESYLEKGFTDKRLIYSNIIKNIGKKLAEKYIKQVKILNSVKKSNFKKPDKKNNLIRKQEGCDCHVKINKRSIKRSFRVGCKVHDKGVLAIK